LTIEEAENGLFKVYGHAIHPIKTYHPNEWPEMRVYLEEELKKAAPTLVGKPFGIDHITDLPYTISHAEWDDEANAIYYEGYVGPEIAQMIKDGKVKGVSIELDWEIPGGKLEYVNGIAPRNFVFTGLDFIVNFEPGDPQAWVKLAEAAWRKYISDFKITLKEAKKPVKEQILRPEDFIWGLFRDPGRFEPDSFRTVWIDYPNGIQGIVGRLKADGSQQIQSILFMKSKGWTLESAKEWLERHFPGYGEEPFPLDFALPSQFWPYPVGESPKVVIFVEALKGPKPAGEKPVGSEAQITKGESRMEENKTEDKTENEQVEDTEVKEQQIQGTPKIVERVVPFEETPTAPIDRPWDANAAEKRIRKWASRDGSGEKETIDWAKYRRAFAWYDPERADDFGGYKLPHHDIVDGKFCVVWRGVAAAMQVLLGARGGVDVPPEDRRGIYNHLAKHYRQFGREPPEFHEALIMNLENRFTELENKINKIAEAVEIKVEVKESNEKTEEKVEEVKEAVENMKEEIKEKVEEKVEEVKEQVKEEIKEAEEKKESEAQTDETVKLRERIAELEDKVKEAEKRAMSAEAKLEAFKETVRCLIPSQRVYRHWGWGPQQFVYQLKRVLNKKP